MSNIFITHKRGTDAETIRKDALLELEAHFLALVQVDESLNLQDTEAAKIHREKLENIRGDLLSSYGVEPEEE